MGEYFRFRRTRRGYEFAVQGNHRGGCRRCQRLPPSMPTLRGARSPMSRWSSLLEAQSAQLRGDRAAVKQGLRSHAGLARYRSLGLRGLYAEARQAQDWTKARDYAERAIKISPTLAWASSGLLALQSSAHDWAAAEATLETQRRSGAIPPKLRANCAPHFFDSAGPRCGRERPRSRLRSGAASAQKLDPALVPAACVAAREHIRRGAVRRAMKVLRQELGGVPHPDLAALAAHARAGDQPEARLERVRSLLAAALAALKEPWRCPRGCRGAAMAGGAQCASALSQGSSAGAHLRLDGGDRGRRKRRQGPGARVAVAGLAGAARSRLDDRRRHRAALDASFAGER